MVTIYIPYCPIFFPCFISAVTRPLVLQRCKQRINSSVRVQRCLWSIGDYNRSVLWWSDIKKCNLAQSPNSRWNLFAVMFVWGILSSSGVLNAQPPPPRPAQNSCQWWTNPGAKQRLWQVSIIHGKEMQKILFFDLSWHTVKQSLDTIWQPLY